MWRSLLFGIQAALVFRAVRLQTSQLFQPLQGRINILFGSTAVIAHQTTTTMPFRQRLAAQEEGAGGGEETQAPVALPSPYHP